MIIQIDSLIKPIYSNFFGFSNFSASGLVPNSKVIVFIIIEIEFGCNLCSGSNLGLIESMSAVNHQLCCGGCCVRILHSFERVHSLIHVVSPCLNIAVVGDQTHL